MIQNPWEHIMLLWLAKPQQRNIIIIIIASIENLRQLAPYHMVPYTCSVSPSPHEHHHVNNPHLRYPPLEFRNEIPSIFNVLNNFDDTVNIATLWCSQCNTSCSYCTLLYIHCHKSLGPCCPAVNLIVFILEIAARYMQYKQVAF